MLRKKETFTIITPIPGFIPRQLAIDILHSHSEVITLNPLVLEHKPIPAPRDAQSDEFYSTWYEITERIQYVPGLGKMGSGVIKFSGCFHDMPWGLQTHIYAPLNVDLRNKYRIAGNQPGVEPPEQPEIGLAALGAPSDGLYLREDIEIKCNVAIVGFVKAQLKAASKEMVQRIIKKAELLDAGVLHAMIENGKLRTINPADRSNTFTSPTPSFQYAPTPGPPTPLSPHLPYQVPRTQSCRTTSQRPDTAASYPPGGYSGNVAPPFGYGYGHQAHAPVELPVLNPIAVSPPGGFAMELPGDFYHQPPQNNTQPSSPSNAKPASHRDSKMSATSDRSPDPSQSSWSAAELQSQTSRPTSIGSDATGPSAGLRSPGMDYKGSAPEMSANNETSVAGTLGKLDPRLSQYPRYDPSSFGGAPAQKSRVSDFAKLPSQQQAPVRGQDYNIAR
jgi:hypothetical protein